MQLGFNHEDRAAVFMYSKKGVLKILVKMSAL